jgi:hypothetical protein
MADQPHRKTDKSTKSSDARSRSTEASPSGSGDRKGEFYEFYENHGRFWITRHSGNHVFYATWYDAETKQTRRRSLMTTSSSEATNQVERLLREDVHGDPIEALRKKPMTTVAEVLDYYQKECGSKLRSSAAAQTAIDHLKSTMGSQRHASLHKRDFLDFAKDFQAAGRTLGYTSRVLSVARAAFNMAEEENKITRAPRVPELRGQTEKDAEPLRGREMTTAEIALLFDNNVEEHLQKFLIGAINSAGRPEAILEAYTAQIDFASGLIDLNPEGRTQTKKHRPIQRIPATWQPWLEATPTGPLVVYNGQPVLSVKKAMRALAKRTKLTGRINATSIRHSIGRYMEHQRVPDKQISIFLGHEPVSRKRTTRRYSPTNPFHPDYLREATAAIECFVREINEHSRKWDLLKPFALKPGWKARR